VLACWRGNHDWGVSWYQYLPRPKCQDNTSNQATTTSFRVVYKFLLASPHIIRGHTLMVIIWTVNNPMKPDWLLNLLLVLISTVIFDSECHGTHDHIVSCRAVSRQRVGKPSRGSGYTCNNRGTVGNGVFYSVRAKGLYGGNWSKKMQLEGNRRSDRTWARKQRSSHS
jgi:hypothetical protein